MSDAIEYLKSSGWRESRNNFKKYSRCLYKRFDTPTQCYCNNEKDGIQIEIAVSEFGEGNESYEISICGQLSDGTWVDFTNFGLPNDIERVISLIPRLLSVWEAANSKA